MNESGYESWLSNEVLEDEYFLLLHELVSVDVATPCSEPTLWFDASVLREWRLPWWILVVCLDTARSISLSFLLDLFGVVFVGTRLKNTGVWWAFWLMIRYLIGPTFYYILQFLVIMPCSCRWRVGYVGLRSLQVLKVVWLVYLVFVSGSFHLQLVLNLFGMRERKFEFLFRCRIISAI